MPHYCRRTAELFPLRGVRFLKTLPKLANLFSRPGNVREIGACKPSGEHKMKSMKMFLFSAALVLGASSNAHATEALLFDGGGYIIEFLIGFVDEPVIAQVRFTPPGDKDSVTIPQKLVHVEKFDMKKRILILQFSNKNDPDLPASFSLSANKTKAVLSIGGKKIKSEFDWDI